MRTHLCISYEDLQTTLVRYLLHERADLESAEGWMAMTPEHREWAGAPARSMRSRMPAFSRPQVLLTQLETVKSTGRHPFFVLAIETVSAVV